jgi:hypothetical protein
LLIGQPRREAAARSAQSHRKTAKPYRSPIE